MAEEWTAEMFRQGEHYFEDPTLDSAKRITVEVKAGGRQLAHVQAREPGILAIVSRPDEQGIAIVMVEAGGVRYVDTRNGVERTQPIEPWAAELLKLAK